MAFPYVKVHADWKDYPDTTTPVTEAKLEQIEAGIASLSSILELVDAKGDLIVGSAADAHVRLAIGNLDEVLSVSSSSALAYRKIVNAMVDAAAAIAVSKLAAGSDGQFLKTVGSTPTWAAGATITAVTALPGAPSDGDVIRFTDSLTAPTYSWLLQFENEKASNKWVHIGGSVLKEVVTNEATATSSYTALATAGPSFTIPIAGDYVVEIGAAIEVTGNGTIARMSYDIGGTGAVDGDSIQAESEAAGAAWHEPSRAMIKTGLAVSTALVAKYKVSANSTPFEKRWMRITPIAVGG